MLAGVGRLLVGDTPADCADDEEFRTGFVVAYRHVLTAAHCVRGLEGERLWLRLPTGPTGSESGARFVFVPLRVLDIDERLDGAVLVIDASRLADAGWDRGELDAMMDRVAVPLDVGVVSVGLAIRTEGFPASDANDDGMVFGGTVEDPEARLPTARALQLHLGALSAALPDTPKGHSGGPVLTETTAAGRSRGLDSRSLAIGIVRSYPRGDAEGWAALGGTVYATRIDDLVERFFAIKDAIATTPKRRSDIEPAFGDADNGLLLNRHSHDAFISYSRSDGIHYAERLDAELSTHGIVSWRDVRDIDPSQDFTAELERAIEASSVVIVCVTPEVRRPDSFVRREIAYARVCGKPVAVARYANISPPISVITNTFFDFYVDWSAAFEELLAFCKSRPPRVDGPAQSGRLTYLNALYSDVVRFLERAIMLPSFTGGTNFLQLSGRLSISDAGPGNGPLSDRFFNLPHRPVSVARVVEAFHRAKGRLAIVGGGGTGKTVSLMGLARDLAAAALIDPAAPLPLVVSAATWLDGSGERRSDLPAWIASETRLAIGYVNELLRSERAVLMIDGIDELPAVHQQKDSEIRTFPRETLICDIPMKCRLVITIRPDEYTESVATLGVHSTFQVDPLRDDQLDEVASRYPQVAAVFELEADIREAARNPLILGLLYSITSRAVLSTCPES